MIRTETYELNGRTFIRTWSDANVLIHGGEPEGDYSEANDPAEFNRTYTETDIPIGGEESAEEIVDILTGVSE